MNKKKDKGSGNPFDFNELRRELDQCHKKLHQERGRKADDDRGDDDDNNDDSNVDSDEYSDGESI